ncbi:CCH1 [Candida jiufengensis]|uniref:CCH1 n=1 Tax=Candida jiufengensis TaxID=497108 RepID=UPI002223FE86|nr:CCH1 [Candida jiufengensis]KAI5955695.1 CCH1 [Candida jiufengensis]
MDKNHILKRDSDFFVSSETYESSSSSQNVTDNNYNSDQNVIDEEYDPNKLYNPFNENRKSVFSDDNFLKVGSSKNHISFFDRSLQSSPILQDNLSDNDFEDLKQGLEFALGKTNEEANWFPVSQSYKNTSQNISRDNISSAPSVKEPIPTKMNADHTSNIPLEDLDFSRPSYSRSQTQQSHHSTNSRSPIKEEGDTRSLKPQNSNNSNYIKNDYFYQPSPIHLEEGLLNPEKMKEPTSPGTSRIADAIARISNRIAGTGDGDVKKDDHPDQSSLINVQSRGSSQLKTPVKEHFSFFEEDNELSPSKQSIKKEVPNVSITTDKGGSMYNETTISQGLGVYLRNSNQSSQVDINNDVDVTSQMSLMHDIESVKKPTGKIKSRLYGNTLFIFSPNSKIRRICHKFIENQFSSSFILFILILQVCLLSYRQWDPANLQGYFVAGYNWADYILILINIIYTIEIALQVISYGLIIDSELFKELVLPYPSGHFDQFWQNLGNIYNFLLNVPFLGKKKGKHVYSDSKHKLHEGSSESSSDDQGDVINDIDIDESFNKLLERRSSVNSYDLSKKYEFDSYHDEITSPKIKTIKDEPRFKLRSTNTFFKTDQDKINPSQLKRAYLRSSWHRLDFVSTFCFWISLLLSIDQYDAKHHIMLFRALSCMRILRLCNLTAGTTTILTACKSAIPQLIDVSIFIACFWLFFGIIGVQSFKSSLTRHCVWTNPNDSSDTYVNDDSYCGSFIGLDGSIRSYITRDGHPSGVLKGYRCPMYSRCVSGDNPYNGTVSFDNILQSLQMVFVVMSANTFTDIMYQTMDSDNMAACLFFIGCIFVLTVWLLNVFIAVIVSSFNMTRLKADEAKQSIANKKILKFFGFDQDPLSHTERIKQLKTQNVFLKYYYRFEFIFVIVIAVSLFVQCFRSYSMSDHRRHLLYRFEVGFTIVFLVEIIIRFLFYYPKWRVFFQMKRNCFDLILAIICTIMVINPVKNRLGHAYYWMTVFQLMRFYRVVLATAITRNLWLKIMSNFKAIFDLAFLYFILLFLMSIIMSRYFEGAIPEDALDDVDFPMNTLPASFIALYVITSTENWTNVMYSLQEYATTTSSRSFGSVLLIMWFMLSNMIILNIFIAVIAKTLEVSEEGKRKQQLYQFIEVMTSKLTNVDEGSGLLKKIKTKLFRRRERKDELEQAVVNLLLSGTAVQEFLDKDLQDQIVEEDEAQSKVNQLPSNVVHRWFVVTYSRIANALKNPFHSSFNSQANFKLDNFEPSSFAKNIIKERNVLIHKQTEFLKKNPRYNYVFYIMGPRHKIRRLCQRMVKPSFGERIDGVPPYRPVSESLVVLTFIATVGLVVLACYMTPIFRMKEAHSNWIFWSEYTFAVVFTVEFIIKVLADGFIFTPNAYCRSSWNLIDLVVLISLWIEALAYLKNDGDLSRIVRGLKALRALRLLTISETAKSNFHNTMIAGFGKIINAAIISLCLLFPFSIWGLNIFNGRLGYCIDGNSNLEDCYDEYAGEVFNWEIVSPNVYTNPQLEFNRFATSFATLFEIVSLEGWTDLLKNLMASTGVGTVPETNATPFNGFFIVLFNFISIVFILTLFISVIISNYSRTTGRAYMTTDQIAWYQVKKILIQVQPSKRKDHKSLSKFRKFCYKMTVEKNAVWIRILNCTLFLHTIALLLECFPSYEGLNNFRIAIYTIASAIFFINALMLVVGQGLRTFAHYKWNIFNLVVSFSAFLTTLIAFGTPPESPFANFNKLFLVIMLLFVIPRSNRLSQLLRFASASLPSILSLSFTWIIIFLVFAIALNQIFGLTKIGPNGSGNINLRSVPKTLIVLFRCSFGEGWNYIMQDYTLSSPFCTAEDSLDRNDCGSKQYAYILFIAWNIISMYIFLNMFISLILDSFDYINQRSNYSLLIQREEIRKFKKTWQKFDPEGSGFIKPIELPRFLHSLEGALSFHFYTGQLEIKELRRRWVKQNSDDPYDVTVNYDAIEETMDQMDIGKIRQRRKDYEMFVEEALLNMELNNDPGISFTRIILQLPLYTTFDTGTCFNLIDYLERRLLISKVMKKVHTKKVFETIAAYACRWKYQQNKKHGIRDDNIAFDKELKRNSYLANENIKINTNLPPAIYVNDEAESNEEDFEKQIPAKRNSVIYGDHSMTSGIYYPNSPIVHTSNNSNKLRSPTRSKRPSLTINVPSMNEVIDDDITRSPFEDENQDPFEDDKIQEILETSSWRDALEEVRSTNQKKKK